MRLGVNVDHVATLRQARGGCEPDPVAAALECERAGADGIVVHLREDRRHIQEDDLRRLRGVVSGRLNLEMAMVRDVIAIALDVKPEQATIVPERREELTTEGGLDVLGQADTVRDVISELNGAGIPVSLFIEAAGAQVRAAAECGAQAVEIHTGHYADSRGAREREPILEQVRKAVELGMGLGLQMHAGHGLDYVNVEPVAAMAGLQELNIGHSIVARALVVGIERAVREMVALIGRGGSTTSEG